MESDEDKNIYKFSANKNSIQYLCESKLNEEFIDLSSSSQIDYFLPFQNAWDKMKYDLNSRSPELLDILFNSYVKQKQ